MVSDHDQFVHKLQGNYISLSKIENHYQDSRIGLDALDLKK